MSVQPKKRTHSNVSTSYNQTYSRLHYVQKKRLFKRKIQRTFFHLQPDKIHWGINIEAFKKLLSIIKLRLKDDNVLKIFQHINPANKGSINFVEFMSFVQTPFSPADQIRLDMSLHLHQPAYFQKYHTWRVRDRPLDFTLVPGPNCIAAYFYESSRTEIYQILQRGARLCFINTLRVKRTNFWDILKVLQQVPCPFNLTFQNLCLPDVMEEKDAMGHYKLVNKDLSEDDKYLLQRYYLALNKSGERIDSFKEKQYFNHCHHCPLKMAWYLNIHLFMEDDSFSRPATVLMYFITFLIFVSTFIYIVETIPGWGGWSGWETLEAVVSILFSVEFAIRLSSCRGVWRYMEDPMNIVDFCAVFPYWFELMSSGSLQPELLRMIRIVRLLRLVRLARSRSLTLSVSILSRTMKSAFQWIVIFIGFIITSIIIVASFEYFFESGHLVAANCENFRNETSCSETGILQRFSFNRTSKAECKISCQQFAYSGCCSFDQFIGSCVFSAGSSATQDITPSKISHWTALCHVEELRVRKIGLGSLPFREIASSMWWAAATVNMVGYGDIYPTSISGRILGAITTILSILCMAFPLIVVGSSFKESIVRIQFRQSVELSGEPPARGVMELLEDMNAKVGEDMFDRDDELVFMTCQINTKKRLQTILAVENGWSVLPYAKDHISDKPRISQFKLWALHGIYGKRFSCVTKARKSYKLAFQQRLWLALKRVESKQWHRERIDSFNFCDDIPLVVEYKPTRFLGKSSLETPEKKLNAFSDKSSKVGNTNLCPKVKNTSKTDEVQVAVSAKQAIGEEIIYVDESPNLLPVCGVTECFEENGHAV